MIIKKNLVITAIASSLITFIVFSPMITFPNGSLPRTSSCAGAELNQIKELERYGTVYIKYDDPIYLEQREEGYWEAAFNSFYKQEVRLRASARKQTMCEAVDTLYYKVMEHPMTPK